MQKCKQLCTIFNFCTHTFFYKDSYSVSPSAKYCPSIRPSTIKTMCMDINKEITTTKVKVQKKLFRQICIWSDTIFLAFWGWMSHMFLENVCFTYHDSIQNNIFWKYLAIHICKPILPTKLHRQNANNLSRRYVVMPNLGILFLKKQ